MNQQFGKQVFDQADKLFKDLLVPGNLQVLAEQGVAASKDFYEKTATATQDGAKALTEIADSAWGSTKMLNEKLMHIDDQLRGDLHRRTCDRNSKVAARDGQAAK